MSDAKKVYLEKSEKYTLNILKAGPENGFDWDGTPKPGANFKTIVRFPDGYEAPFTVKDVADLEGKVQAHLAARTNIAEFKFLASPDHLGQGGKTFTIGEIVYSAEPVKAASK